MSKAVKFTPGKVLKESLQALLTYPLMSLPGSREAVDEIAKTVKDMRQPDNITFVAVFVSELEQS